MTTLALADADIHYELKGSGLPVLFIQGVGTTGSAWNPQSDVLSKDFHCLQFDNRGIGQSTDRGGQLSVEKMAEDTRDLLDAVGWHSAHVVGHSMGGIIAQQLALAAPERVRSLSLLCTFSKGSEGASPTPWAIWMALRTRLGPRAWRRRAFLEMLFPTDYLAQCDKDVLAAEIAPIVGRDLADQPPVLMRQVRALGAHDASTRLGELAPIPTLVLSAEHDPIAKPEYGQRLSRAITGSRYVEIANAAHGVTIQNAAEINELLEQHITDSETNSST
jgi:pimeloyl-ACP methyl ester carboxylesterase